MSKISTDRAMKQLLTQVPALSLDARPAMLQGAAHRMSRVGSELGLQLLQQDPAQLAASRQRVLQTGFTPAMTAAGGIRPVAVVSGGSYAGMLDAILLAKAGFDVKVVELRPNYSREIRLVARQGTRSVLAGCDPELAKAFDSVASKLDPHALRMLNLIGHPDGGAILPFDFSRLEDPKYLAQLRRRGLQIDPTAPESPNTAIPGTGRQLLKNPYSFVIVAREFERAIRDVVEQKYAGQIQFVDGALKLEKHPDGTATWTAEQQQKDGTFQSVDFLKGAHPEVVFGHEGARSSLREALGFESAPTTRSQGWIAGLVKAPDTNVEVPGAATLSSAAYCQPTSEVDGKAGQCMKTVPTGISDGKSATWVLAPMPEATAKTVTPEQVASRFEHAASVVTGRSEEEIRTIGTSGPIAFPGSLPAAFTLQGRSARQVTDVLPDGTTVAIMGDSAETGHFKAAGGMNTALFEVEHVKAFLIERQSGMDPTRAAKRLQNRIFASGDAWGEASIPYFYPELPAQKLPAAERAWRTAAAQWRMHGGATPQERFEAVFKLGN